MISEASQLSNSVLTLQEWGNMVIENSRTIGQSSNQENLNAPVH